MKNRDITVKSRKDRTTEAKPNRGKSFFREWNKAVEVEGRKGRSLPYIMVIVGLFYLLQIPLKTDKLLFFNGCLDSYEYTETSLFIHIKDENYQEETFKVDVKKYRELLHPILPSVKYVKIWTQDHRRFKSNIKQLEADGEMIILYNWWNHTWFHLCLVIIGILLIVPVEKSYQKWLKSQKEKDEDS